MGRQSKPTPPKVDVQFNEVALRSGMNALTEMGAIERAAHERTTELAEQMGYQGDVSPQVLEQQIRGAMRRTQESCLELGCLLLLLKERTGHGMFREQVVHLGIDWSLAAKFMNAAFKFTRGKGANKLVAAAGNQSKLLELLVLDDQEVAALNSGKAVGGIELSDIEAMSVRELRAELQKLRGDVEGKQSYIDRQAKRLEKAESRGKWTPTEDSPARTEVQQSLIDALKKEMVGAIAQVNRIDALLIDINNDGSEELMSGAQHVLNVVARRLWLTAEGNRFELSPKEAAGPDWLVFAD